MAVRKRKYSLLYFKHLQKLKAAYKQNINEFLNNSAINGLSFFNRQDFSIAERLYFIVAFVVAVASSIFFVILVAKKWSYSPTIISIKPGPTFITDDPFPAVTICNMNQALSSRVAQFSKYSQEYATVQGLCNRKSNITIADTITQWKTIDDLILNISQPCERMLLQCTFGGVEYNCTELFHPVLMDEGLCCSFNTLDPVFVVKNLSSNPIFNITHPPNVKPVGWTLEYGYQSPLPKYYSPMKAVGAGQSLGLNVILDVDSAEYYCSSGNSIGFKISVHNPDEEPNIRETGLLISPGAESLVRIIPNKLEADEKLRQLDVKLRNCAFENEYDLLVFSHYSYFNCMYECLTEMIRSRCGCDYSYMRINGHLSKLRSCGSTRKHWKCLESVKASETDCAQYCWPDCFSKQYIVNIFSAKLDNTIGLSNPKIDNKSNAYVQNNIAIVKIYLDQNTYVNIIRAPYIGSIDVLSSIGGLICVFFGFSFISLAEFIYYICIRPWRSITSNTSEANIHSWQKPGAPNRSINCFENPYGNQAYKFKTQRSFALPRKVWHINTLSNPITSEEEH